MSPAGCQDMLVALLLGLTECLPSFQGADPPGPGGAAEGAARRGHVHARRIWEGNWCRLSAEHSLCSSGAVGHRGWLRTLWWVSGTLSLCCSDYRECKGSVLVLFISAFSFYGQSCLFCLREGSGSKSPMALRPGRVGSCQSYLGEVTAHTWGGQITADLSACSDLLLLGIFFIYFTSSGASLNLNSCTPSHLCPSWVFQRGLNCLPIESAAPSLKREHS